MSDQSLTEPGLIPETTVVYLDNVGPTDFLGVYASQRYPIPAGTRTIVPYFAMCLWMGDPRAVDVNDRDRYRLWEWERLRTKYGAYDDMAAWEANKPKLVATSLAGEVLVTVVDDPEGDHLKSSTVNVAEQQSIRDAMRAMQANIQRLEAELARTQGLPTNAVTIDGTGSDEADSEPVDGEDIITTDKLVQPGHVVIPPVADAPVVEDSPDISTIKGGQ